MRLLLALAEHMGWKINHMDVKCAFLNGGLEEEVYLSQPPRTVVWFFCIKANFVCNNTIILINHILDENDVLCSM